jgi:hypothetical protein
MPKETLCVMAICVGHYSALAFYFASAPAIITAEDMPIACGQIDCVTLGERIRQMRPDIAVVERAGPGRRRGIQSTFKFALAYGAVLGVLGALGIRTHSVKTIKWKEYFSLGREECAACRLAIRLWPACVPSFEGKGHRGRAEAALLARYGAEMLAK